ncbi:hypothetical protein [Nitrospira sp. Kam-Ns4a]
MASRAERVWIGLTLTAALSGAMACTGASSGGPSADLVRMPDRVAQWQAGDAVLKDGLRTAHDRYRRDASIEALQGYETAVRQYLDHGFTLYRSYKAAKLDPPDDLLPSLEQRTALLMDVADEYIKHGSLAVGEGIAEELVHNYSDLPVMTPAQRRAEAVLLRYRYRQDY